LQAKLTGHEEQALGVKPTNNPEAYDAYLRGVVFEARSAPFLSWDARNSYERAVQLDPNFATAWARLSRAESLHYMIRDDTHGPRAARAGAAKTALENAQRLEPDSPETRLTLGYYQYRVMRDFEAAKKTFGRVATLLPGSSEARYALGRVARLEGHFDQGIAYLEQALTLDPANAELVGAAAFTYALLKQFPAALKLYGRALDLKPNDPQLMAYKAGTYQGQGNLQEAAKLLSGINETSIGEAFGIKILQLQYERDFREAIRLLQARLARAASDYEKADALINLAYIQRLAGDTAEARVTAEKARNTLEQRYRDRPDDAWSANNLSYAYALIGEKDLALKLAQRAVMLLPRAKDPMYGPGWEENLAQVQTMFGENSNGVISTLAQLLQTPYQSTIYRATGVTPAILRLDPIWDPLRVDPAFQKLCEEKYDLTTNGPAFR